MISRSSFAHSRKTSIVLVQHSLSKVVPTQANNYSSWDTDFVRYPCVISSLERSCSGLSFRLLD